MNEYLLFGAQIFGALAALLALPGTLTLWRWTRAARRKPEAVAHGLLPSRARVMVLVPAHNEAALLPQTLPLLLDAVRQDGNSELVVIADNCMDGTARIACALGAAVLERHDTAHSGKGYALEFAFAHLAEQADWFLVVDADTQLSEGYFDALRQTLAQCPAGVQTRYLPQTVEQDWQAPLRHWALQGFNTLRPRARARLGEPIGLLGNGFVLSARTLSQVPYSGGSIVEDLQYQLALTRAGLVLAWCEEAVLYGEMPSGAGARVQRCRWEGGRFALLRDEFPALAKGMLAGDRCARCALEELLLLPLSLHLFLLLAGLAAPAPLSWTAMAGVLVLCAHAGLALQTLPSELRWAALRVLPRYLGWKLMQLPGIVRQMKRGAAWVRSSRQCEQAVIPQTERSER